MNNQFTANVDDAINTFAEDLLKRTPFVDRLASILRAAPADSSNVFALYGEWGSGKTSVKNLLIKRLSQKKNEPGSPEIVEFNPWAFSTQGELFNSFFSETSKVLGRKDAGDVAVGLARLGSYFSIGATAAKSLQVVADLALVPGGGLLGLAADTLKAGSEHAKKYSDKLKEGKIEGLNEVRAGLARALQALDRPILVIVDDIDRLPPDQILQMFQLIRVNASLPKINFLLLMDQGSVAKALAIKGYSADYLDKIVQFALHLPMLSESELKEFLTNGLKEILSTSAPAFDWERWDEMHNAALVAFLDTPRKIRRILQTFRFHLTIFTDGDQPEVDLVDLFGLEVLRLYLVPVWEALPGLFSPLFDHSVGDFIAKEEKRPTRLATEVDATISLAPNEQAEPCRRLLHKLLPQIKRSGRDSDESEHLRTCRLCTEIHFPSYFILSTNAAYPTQKELGTLPSVLTDGHSVLTKLRQWTKKYTFRRVLTKLHPALRDVIDPDMLRNLLAALWRLAEEDAANYPLPIDIPNDFVTESFTTFLLQKIPNEAKRVEVALTAYRQSKAVYPLLRYTGYCLYSLSKSPHTADEIPFAEANLRAIQKEGMVALRSLAERGRLIHHPRLASLLGFWRNEDGEKTLRDWLVSVGDSDEVFLNILIGLFGVSTSASGSRGKYQSERKYAIARSSLEPLFTLDQTLKERVDKVDRGPLNSWQLLALDEVLRNIDQKEKGIKEADYGIPD